MFEKDTQIFICLTSYFVAVSCTYNIRLDQNGPIVKGATITFNATVYYGKDVVTNENLKYQWVDNAIPQHEKNIESTSGTDIWPVTYNLTYPQGLYEVQLIVTRCYTLNIFCYPIGSVRQYFYITETLNGKLELHQDNATRTRFVSSKHPVTHSIHLKETDANYIKSAPVIVSYWFVDCVYYGFTKDFQFDFNYTSPDSKHVVETLIMADFTPLPPITTVPPSTSTSTTTTTSKPTTTSPTTTKPTTKTTTTKPTSTVTTLTTTKQENGTVGITHPTVTSVTAKHLSKREISTPASVKRGHIMVNVKGALVPYNGSFPYVCNNTHVTIDPTKSYGYFSQVIQVKAPLTKPNITGNNWLQPGDLLSLSVSCSGSKDMFYCIQYKRGEYNVTGNETCWVYSSLETCDFSITRYLTYPKNTIVIIIKNDVSRVVTPVTVNIYKVNKQAQLSVIVVPVAFSLVAVVLIVFGVAYYIQNRSRFIVEVADFNFSQQYSEVEYKTFRERLRDSVTNAFTRGPTPSNSEVPVWPPGQKYGSMT